MGGRGGGGGGGNAYFKGHGRGTGAPSLVVGYEDCLADGMHAKHIVLGENGLYVNHV